MVDKYRAICSSCKVSFIVNYGRETKSIAHEIYSCSSCKNLFSLSQREELECPGCGRKELVRYNFHKAENIRYYKKMFGKGLLPEDKYDLLVDYWDKMVSKRCPVCSKDTLEWHIVVDSQGSEPCIYQ